MPRLTKRLIDAAKPEGADYFIWDEEIPGFGLRVFATGKKSYLVQYRKDGRTRRVSFGRHGTMTPEEARKKAREILVAVGEGQNPAEEIRQNRYAPTMEGLCDRFIDEHARNRCKPDTLEEYLRSIKLHIKPVFGRHKIKSVSRADVAKLHHEMRDRPYQANRVLAILSKMFNLAEVWGLRPDGSNPCRHVKKYKETKRERYLTAEELTRLGEVLVETEKEGSESPFAIAAFRLLILTGCRMGEIQTLKWAYVRGNQLHLPDSKTGAKRVYLGPPALDVLAGLRRLEGNEYVIAGKLPGQYLTDLERPWRRIRIRAKLEDVRIHDLRHSFASGAVMMGESLPMIGKLLGHTQVQTTARYAHLADDPVQASASRISQHIASMMNGKAGQQVTPDDSEPYEDVSSIT
ncbi:MAG: integrase arm-type DNA-binding domain-containing protein [Alphaproteobacteria bacterium]|nr:integrase arm-type DNA-binding domain-containing protein [Alphaproteobacteria bacterium]